MHKLVHAAQDAGKRILNGRRVRVLEMVPSVKFHGYYCLVEEESLGCLAERLTKK